MSSLAIITKTNKIPSRAYLSNDGEPEPKEERVGEGKRATWEPGGYTPTRDSWHSLRGRITRFFA